MINKKRFIIWAAFLVCGVSLLTTIGCGSVNIKEVASTQRPLQLEQYFEGKTRAHGILFDRSGVAQRYFDVDITGTWNEETQQLILDEHFLFDDGERDRRIWYITKHSEQDYTGKADDVAGPAQGHVKDNVLHWTYTLQIPYQGSVVNVDIEDWMFRQSESVLLNRAVMRKFGFRVGEILITFKKL